MKTQSMVIYQFISHYQINAIQESAFNPQLKSQNHSKPIN
ncbi:unnamed protein product [Paramecium octaurelia]|uniref:Uncharacterized protein n=1 Tax=Paramecium octaurelia TaxID=43137 RepID=A0A8S1UPQ9_PAROT|nr:unnamed protein product [Paramecium octaurelia]